MPLKRHHKILIGSLSSLVIIFMIATGILLYLMYLNQTVTFDRLENKIDSLDVDLNSKVSQLTETLVQTKGEVESISGSIGTLDQELDLLKASAGEDFSGIIEDAVLAVVTIKTNAGFQGTGFIIDGRGYIVTNAHVLADESGFLASSIQALTSNQETIDAEFLGHNSQLDIALLKIPGNYNKLDLGNSNNVQTGEKVIAIGNPLGLQFSVSQGIVSGIHRQGSNGLEIYIQTDAALNPGNSGGPLINQQGKVIGINNFKISGGESLGFALESNYIKDAVNDIAQEALNQTLIS